MWSPGEVRNTFNMGPPRSAMVPPTPEDGNERVPPCMREVPEVIKVESGHVRGRLLFDLWR